MKTTVILTMLVLLFGCSQGPDFSGPVNVMSKRVEYGVTTYVLKSDQGMSGQGMGVVEFKAPQEFAFVGDTIVFKDNCLVAVKPDKGASDD